MFFRAIRRSKALRLQSLASYGGGDISSWFAQVVRPDATREWMTELQKKVELRPRTTYAALQKQATDKTGVAHMSHLNFFAPESYPVPPYRSDVQLQTSQIMEAGLP